MGHETGRVEENNEFRMWNVNMKSYANYRMIQLPRITTNHGFKVTLLSKGEYLKRCILETKLL